MGHGGTSPVGLQPTAVAKVQLGLGLVALYSRPWPLPWVNAALISNRVQSHVRRNWAAKKKSIGAVMLMVVKKRSPPSPSLGTL